MSEDWIKEVEAQLNVKYTDEKCELCGCRFDEKGLCGCGAPR